MGLLGRIGNLLRGMARSATRIEHRDRSAERQVEEEVAAAEAEAKRARATEAAIRQATGVPKDDGADGPPAPGPSVKRM